MHFTVCKIGLKHTYAHTYTPTVKPYSGSPFPPSMFPKVWDLWKGGGGEGSWAYLCGKMIKTEVEILIANK